MAEDNWIHRSKLMSCASCMYYVAKAPAPGLMVSKRVGRCRRNAPTMNGWPVMIESDWCGQHKLDENKTLNMDEVNPLNKYLDPDRPVMEGKKLGR